MTVEAAADTGGLVDAMGVEEKRSLTNFDEVVLATALKLGTPIATYNKELRRDQGNGCILGGLKPRSPRRAAPFPNW